MSDKKRSGPVLIELEEAPEMTPASADPVPDLAPLRSPSAMSAWQ